MNQINILKNYVREIISENNGNSRWERLKQKFRGSKINAEDVVGAIGEADHLELIIGSFEDPKNKHKIELNFKNEHEKNFYKRKHHQMTIGDLSEGDSVSLKDYMKFFIIDPKQFANQIKDELPSLIDKDPLWVKLTGDPSIVPDGKDDDKDYMAGIYYLFLLNSHKSPFHAWLVEKLNKTRNPDFNKQIAAEEKYHNDNAAKHAAQIEREQEPIRRGQEAHRQRLEQDFEDFAKKYINMAGSREQGLKDAKKAWEESKRSRAQAAYDDTAAGRDAIVKRDRLSSQEYHADRLSKMDAENTKRGRERFQNQKAKLHDKNDELLRSGKITHREYADNRVDIDSKSVLTHEG